MTAGLNYPDDLYADHLAKQTPTGAYDARHSACDPVNHPAHYQRAGIETIDYIRASLGDGFGPYCIGNVLKYVSRYREKGGIQDLSKAQVYLRWAIKAMSKHALNELAAENQKLGLYDDASRIATPAELAELRSMLSAEELKGFGIGDVPRHPMQAEADRIADDRL